MFSLFTLHTATAQDATWFEDITEIAGLKDEIGFRINISDINGDDYPDIIVVTNVHKRNQLRVYLNEENPLSAGERIFVDFTEESNVNAHPDTTVDARRADIICLADLDNDGDNDMVSGIFHTDPAQITEELKEDRCHVLLNDGTGVFSILPDSGLEDLGFISISGMSYLDYDLDGNLDIYLATYSLDHPKEIFDYDRLLKGNGDGTFTDVTNTAGLQTVVFPMNGATVTDWNNDLLPDLLSSAYCRSSGSLWQNNGDGTFTDVAQTAGYSSQKMKGDNGQALCQWGAHPFDFDTDGDMDVLQILVHGGLGITEGRTVLSVNQGEIKDFKLEWELDRLIRADPQSTHLGDMDAAWFDMDNDGFIDLLISETVYQDATDRLFVYRQDSAHYFQDVTPELDLVSLNSPHALEVMDFDLDGDDDILVEKFRNGKKLVLLENKIGQENNWIGVKLIPPPHVNANAIGSRVYVNTPKKSYMREVQAGVGHFGGQQPLILNFGLGKEDSIVESIIVYWPQEDPFSNPTIEVYPPINQIYTLEANPDVSIDEAISSIQSGTHFKLYPNPASDYIVLQNNQSNTFWDDEYNKTIYLMDMKGRLIQTYVVSPDKLNNSPVLSLKGLAGNAYYLLYISDRKNQKEESYLFYKYE